MMQRLSLAPKRTPKTPHTFGGRTPDSASNALSHSYWLPVRTVLIYDIGISDMTVREEGKLKNDIFRNYL